MKKYCILYMLIFLLFCFSSCSKTSDENLNQIISSEKETSDENSSQIISSEKETSVDVSAINDIIKNKKQFYCTEKSQYIYFKDFNSENYLIINDDGSYEYTTNDSEEINHSYNRFCVIDLDGDGNKELLLESSTSNILVFHYENDIVYGFVFPYRGMLNIKLDGTFESSGGASFASTRKINFLKEKIYSNELCYFDELNDIYKINDKEVSQDKVEMYLKTQDKKKNIGWYQYNNENLEKYF